MCFYSDENGPSVFREKRTKARKVHKCSECEGEIAVGEVYRNIFGVWDGEYNVFKICEPCEQLRARIKQHELAEGCRADEAVCPLGGLDNYLMDRRELSGIAGSAARREAFMSLPIPERKELHS